MAQQGKLRGIVFDWDGTLLDSFASDLHAYRVMFHALGVPWGEAELRAHYSPNWHRVYEAAGIPPAQWKEADRLWRQAYRGLRPALLPGARQALHHLAEEYSLGLVTSGSRGRVTRQLRNFGLWRIFKARVFGEDCARRKPHPDPLQRGLRMMRLGAGECLYVGDSAEDVIMARRAGTRCVAVLGPFPTHERLRAARPVTILDSVRCLPAWLATRSAG